VANNSNRECRRENPFSAPVGKGSRATNFCHTQKLRQLFESDIGEARASERKGYLKFSGEIRIESVAMTLIPAKIIAVDKQADKHRIVVRIVLRRYRGSFNTLKFGENKPLMGSCHDGQLDLIYYRDPGLKEGESFPLWTIQ
jgi:hypothetical protein